MEPPFLSGTMLTLSGYKYEWPHSFIHLYYILIQCHLLTMTRWVACTVPNVTFADIKVRPCSTSHKANPILVDHLFADMITPLFSIIYEACLRAKAQYMPHSLTPRFIPASKWSFQSVAKLWWLVMVFDYFDELVVYNIVNVTNESHHLPYTTKNNQQYICCYNIKYILPASSFPMQQKSHRPPYIHHSEYPFKLMYLPDLPK